MAASDIRCLTVLGHVDHGKTTFVDSLLAANNIISQRMAGKIRYLDSRQDEQERGITMESSAISLRFKMNRRTAEGGTALSSYVINLIDTPGHVDFSSEVSTASRLCDGALVLVDVVEGVCTQTIAVLRQAWTDRLRPVLVINKFDRLITQLKLSPSEAYHHLVQLIENVNAVMGSFHAGERMEDDLRWREERERRLAAKKEAAASRMEGRDTTESVDADVEEEVYEERDDEDIYFAPERGNVIFACAIDGWAFRVGKFAQLYAKKLGINEGNLRKALWGDFYLDPKTKRVLSHRQLKGRNLKPLFVQFVLENIWAVYENVAINPNPERVQKIVTSLELTKILPRDLRSKDTRHTLNLIFSQWLSLSTCTFQTAVEIIPPPSIAQRTRIPKMLWPELVESTVVPKTTLEKDLFECNDNPGANGVAYVSKMFAVPYGRLPKAKTPSITKTAEEMRREGRRPRAPVDEAAIVDSPTVSDAPVASPSAPPPPESSADLNGPTSDIEPHEAESTAEVTQEPDAEQEVLLGFARLYSGTLREGQSLYCLLPKYDHEVPPSHPRNRGMITIIKIEGLYEMMGRDLVATPEVKAGNVCAIRGLEGKVYRNATLCAPGFEPSSETEKIVVDEANVDQYRVSLVSLAGVNAQAKPIVRVALEPTEPANMPQLIRGLKLLSQSDPCAEAFQQQTGEWVILTAGELHLERCLRDLRERFAKVDIQASQPIVPFRETALSVPDMNPIKSPLGIRGAYSGQSQGIVQFTMRANPLPSSITQFLQSNVTLLKRIQRELHQSAVEASSASGEAEKTAAEEAEEEETSRATEGGDLAQKPTVKYEDFWPALDKLLEEAGGEWKGLGGSIWAFGPNRIGPNILFHRAGDVPDSIRSRLDRRGGGSTRTDSLVPPEFEGNIESGFQIATFQGPMCAEPVEGMAYFLDAIEFDKSKVEGDHVHSKMAQVTGSLITASKEACRSGLLDWSPRLKMAVYTCDIQASTEVLGRVYAVVARRRGRIVSEEMKEGTSFFSINAILPVIESFGFSDEIRKRTSGAASPQLIFGGYEILDQDPFWVPTTEEELEDLGDKADRVNVARVYMDKVRSRKGMFVEQKVVEAAEKQRTLKR